MRSYASQGTLIDLSRDFPARQAMQAMDTFLVDVQARLSVAGTAAATPATGVTSLAVNGGATVDGAVNILDGTDIDVSRSGQDITISVDRTSLAAVFLKRDGTNSPTANMPWGGFKITGLAAGSASGDSLAHSLNPLNHLAAATATYNMAGNTLTNFGGCPSSNAALLEFVGNLADAAATGIRVRWNSAAAPAGQRFAFDVQANDATGARDLMKVGYNSASQATLWLPDSNGGGSAGISEFLLMAGGHSDYNFADTVGFRFLPQFGGGSIWVYAGSQRAMTLQAAQTAIGIGASGAPWSLSSNDLYLMQSSVRDVAQGSYQMGFFDNTAPVSGRHLALYRGLIPITGNVTGLEFSVDYQGKVRGGVAARASDTPTDGFFGAHGWIEASTSANQIGVDNYFAAGSGTGNSVIGGDVYIQTPDAGASGTAAQALTNKAKFARAGKVTIKAGTSTGLAASLGGTVNQSGTQTGNTALTETDLFSYSVPANTLATDGDSIEFYAGGTFAGTASVDKRIRVKFGATTLIDTGALAVTVAGDWRIEGQIIRTGAATQKAIVTIATNNAALVATADYTTPAETLSGAVMLKVTGQGTNASDVVGELWKAEWRAAA